MDLIQFSRGASTLVLQGSSMATSHRGAVLWTDGKATSLAEQSKLTVEEDLRLTLQGTTAEIETALGVLAGWLEEAARVAAVPGEVYVYLEVRLLSTGVIWRSMVKSGKMETIGAGSEQRATKNQGVRLLLTRLNYWEDNTQRELSISTQLDTAATGGVEITNHWDSAHSCYVDLAASAAGGDVPAPVRFSFLPSGMSESATVFAGENVNYAPTTLVVAYEGESATAGTGVTRTVTADANASSGSYGRFSWSGTSELVICEFAISNTDVTAMGGLSFLPLMRINAVLTAGEDFWARWRVVAKNGATYDILHETKPGYLVNNDGIQSGAPLCIPPWKVESSDALPGLSLQLVIQADDTGSHLIDIDYLLLLPMEYWRVYKALTSVVGGIALYDNPYTGTVKSYSSLMLHQAEGPGLWVWPGKAQRFYFLIEGLSSGGTAISIVTTIRMYYRPRKRSL